MLTSLISLQQRNVKKPEKLMKTVNIDGENLYIFWTTWDISMKFSGKMWLMVILKVAKRQTLPPLYKIHFWKNHWWVNLTPSLFRFNDYQLGNCNQSKTNTKLQNNSYSLAIKNCPKLEMFSGKLIVSTNYFNNYLFPKRMCSEE